MLLFILFYYFHFYLFYYFCFLHTVNNNQYQLNINHLATKGRAGKIVLLLSFSCERNGRKIVAQNATFGAQKPHFKEPKKQNQNFKQLQSLLLEICNCRSKSCSICRKIAISYSFAFLTHDVVDKYNAIFISS